MNTHHTHDAHPATHTHGAHDARLHASRTADTTVVTDRPVPGELRTVVYKPRRSRWPGLLTVAVLATAVTAVLVSNYYDDRTLGQRIDATVNTAQETAKQQVAGIQSGAEKVAEQGARTAGQLADGLKDAAITTAVKAALAADPALSALKIEVNTQAGIVTLSGPAPDSKSRDRAGVLAAAPEGVRSVDNRLVVAGSTQG